jgi:nicotinate-nucleotide adenylyltransferase
MRARTVRRSVRRSRSATRLGVFGGTFDPPHFAHLAIAERAREELALDRVLFVPAGRPPHKNARAVVAIADRLAMTRLAVKRQPAFRVSDLEANRTGPSYTVDTLETLAARYPDVELVLVIGEDSLAELPTWRDPERVLELASVAVAPRITSHGGGGGNTRLPERLARSARVTWLSGPRVDLSSTELRERARRGRSLRYLVPDAVIAYLERRRVYRSRS